MDRCPACGSDRIHFRPGSTSVVQDGVTLTAYQEASTCTACGEIWSTSEECAKADALLVAQGWKPRGHT